VWKKIKNKNEWLFKLSALCISMWVTVELCVERGLLAHCGFLLTEHSSNRSFRLDYGPSRACIIANEYDKLPIEVSPISACEEVYDAGAYRSRAKGVARVAHFETEGDIENLLREIFFEDHDLYDIAHNNCRHYCLRALQRLEAQGVQVSAEPRRAIEELCSQDSHMLGFLTFGMLFLAATQRGTARRELPVADG